MSNRKPINNTLDKDLYDDVMLTAQVLSRKTDKKVNGNELIEEGMEMVLNKYKKKIEEII